MHKPLSRESLADQVAEAIAAMILDEGLRTGDALPSGAELEERFDVSRTVVREALASLAGQGLVSRGQGRETVVATPQGDQLTTLLRFQVMGEAIQLPDVLQLRRAIETMTARDAAERRTDLQVASMREALRNLQHARSDAAFQRADIAVHRAITEASGNRLALVILDSLESILQARVVAARRRRARGESAKQVIREHTQIVDAIEAADSEQAASMMDAHLAAVARYFDPGSGRASKR